MSSKNRTNRRDLMNKLAGFGRNFRNWLRLPAVADGKIKGQSDELIEKAKAAIAEESAVEGEVREIADALGFTLYSTLQNEGDEDAWITGVRALHVISKKRAFYFADLEIARRSGSDAVYAPLFALAKLLTEKGKGRNERAGKFIPAVKFNGWDFEEPKDAARRLFGALLHSSNELLGAPRVRRAIILEMSEKLSKAELLTAEQLLGMCLTVFGEIDTEEAGVLAEEFVKAELLSAEASDAAIAAYEEGNREEAPADATADAPEAPPAEEGAGAEA